MTTSTDYRIGVRINARADVVFDAVTTTESLTAWWSKVTGSGITGGELRFPMVADQRPLLIHVDEATRPTTVRWTVTDCTFMEDWVGTQPTFTITPIDHGSCELIFEHRGLDERLDVLEKHHADRLAEIEGIVRQRPGISSWDTTLALTWSRPWEDIPDYMQRAANGETLAHLVLLERGGRVRRESNVPARFFVAE